MNPQKKALLIILIVWTAVEGMWLYFGYKRLVPQGFRPLFEILAAIFVIMIALIIYLLTTSRAPPPFSIK